MFDSTFKRDLDAFLRQIDDQIAAETHVEIHCDLDTGVSWEDPQLTPAGDTLQRAATALRGLCATLDAVADASVAEAIRDAL